MNAAQQALSDADPWYEPDLGLAVEPGPHPHYALWDHVGRKWDPLPDGAASLDTAWQEAEAALPEGWCSISLYHYDDGDGSEHTPGTYAARALDPAPNMLPLDHEPIYVFGYADTPAAALHALALALRAGATS